MTAVEQFWAFMFLWALLTPTVAYLTFRFRTAARMTRSELRQLQTLFDSVSALNQEVVSLARKSGATVTMSPAEDTYKSWVDTK